MFTTTPSCYYEGQPFEMTVLDDALRYLADAELIKGTKSYGNIVNRPSLTKMGIDCAEHFGGSVSNYERRNETGSGNTSVTFNGAVTGSNVAWQNHGGVNQTANTGISADKLVELVGALKQALPVLGMDAIDVPKLQGQLDVVEGELQSGEPDAAVVKSVMKRVLGKVGDVAMTSLGLVLTAYAKDLMHKAGVPLE